MRKQGSDTQRKIPFTLVELAAACGILLLTASIIVTASVTFYKGYVHTRKVTEELDTFLKIDRIMDSCVRQMIPFTWKDENDREQILFNGRTDKMQFACLRRSAAGGKGAFLFVRLRVDEESRLIAEYSSYPRFHWETDTEYEYTVEVLAEKVSSISFLYANQDPDDEDEIQWVEEWREYSSDADSADDDFLDIPMAVQMKVNFSDGRSEVWLRRTCGQSRHTTIL